MVGRQHMDFKVWRAYVGATTVGVHDASDDVVAIVPGSVGGELSEQHGECFSVGHALLIGHL
jgi:hypothetical protein